MNTDVILSNTDGILTNTDVILTLPLGSLTERAGQSRILNGLPSHRKRI